MAESTDFITIDDFSPGIFSDYHAASGQPTDTTTGFIGVKNGAAVIADTYRCCADESGALGPLPKATASGRTLSIPAQTTSAYWATNRLAYYLTDAAIMGPNPVVGTGGWGTAGAGTYYTAASYTFYYAADAAGVGSGYRQYHMTRTWNSSGTQRDPFFDNSDTGRSFDGDIWAGGLVFTKATVSTPITVDGLATVLCGITMGQFPRTTDTAIVAADQPLTTADTDFTGGYYTTSREATPTGEFVTGCQWFYPDPAAPNAEGYWVNINDNRPRFPHLLVAHQDRLIVACKEYSTTFAGVGNGLIKDVIQYSAPLDPKVVDSNSRPFRTHFGADVTGTGVIASITTDRLLVVKFAGGGYLIQGDMATPSITKLPFIESTYGVSCYPALTPMGVVYGTRNGVFLWAGGEDTVKLSKQIQGHFWNCAVTGHAQYGGSSGRFAWFHPWVACPNNWLWDSRGQGWWRLDTVISAPPVGVTDTPGYYNAPFVVYVTNPSTGNLHAFPKLLSHTQTVIDYIFDPTVLATSYSWKSQPLVESRRRLRSYQSVRLVASGKGTQTVVFTFSGYNEAGTAVSPVTETFTWTAADSTDRPVVLEHNISTNFVAMDVQVKIAVSASSTNPAAKIHSVVIGTRDRQKSQVDRGSS